jgi:ATP-dependent DNA helicase RecQ
MVYSLADLELSLATHFGYQHFRGLQAPIIEHVLSGQSALLIMPTGGGKSLCYQLPALLLDGLTLVISPLIALMENQVLALQSLGLAADRLTSLSSLADYQALFERIETQSLKLLYVSPERAVLPSFMARLRSATKLSLIAVDEAHCVSQWGHQFRPEYQKLQDLFAAFPQTPVLALTATADAKTEADIMTHLGLGEAPIFRTSVNRPNIFYQVIEKNGGKEQLLRFIDRKHRQHAGVVYCSSRKRVDEIHLFLSSKGLKSLPYHAGLSSDVRAANLQAFLLNENIIMVATIAFGMGIDKPNIRFVAHLDLPQNIESFYQESGRAGRDGLPADSWLCFGLNDLIRRRDNIDKNDVSDDEQISAHHKLEALNAWCESSECRRNILLRYFGETADEPCQYCDNCMDPPQTMDMTLQAQQALSAIYRCGQRFSTHHVIDILRGIRSPSVLKHDYDQLPTFGVGHSLSDKAWRAIIRQLYSSGIIDIVIDDFYALRLKDAARPILKGEQRVALRPLPATSYDKKRAPVFAQPKTERQTQLYQALVQWRTTQAKLEKLPPYLILSDVTLEKMTQQPPKTTNDLRLIEGLNVTKMRRYGDDLIALVQNYDAAKV